MSKTLGVWEGTVGGWVDTVDCSYDMIDGLLNGLCNWLYYRGVGSGGAMGVRPPNNKVGGPAPQYLPQTHFLMYLTNQKEYNLASYLNIIFKWKVFEMHLSWVFTILENQIRVAIA